MAQISPSGSHLLLQQDNSSRGIIRQYCPYTLTEVSAQ